AAGHDRTSSGVDAVAYRTPMPERSAMPATTVPSTASPAVRVDGGWRLPGIANLHSHAFQRAMAGLAERQTHPEDSFWTWRETMYRMAARFDPDLLHAVASQLYVEMLEAGYTTVCEFHYLHHAPDGRPYANASAMSDALIAAARDTGIRLTLLPVLYMTGGFDGRALGERQKRFGHGVDDYLRLFESLRGRRDDMLQVGCALHSLRAVPPDAMRTVLAALPADARIHIHVAEQVGEVQDCIAVRDLRPVEWLLQNAAIDARWTLVHATHLNAWEVAGIAKSGATVAICPTTEATLGDGLFRLRDYLDAGGAWGIGSDSHISVSPVAQLRWLEYGPRLVKRRRNIAVGASSSVGETLLHGAYASAANATGFDAAGDMLVLDAEAPLLAAAAAGDVADRWLFSGNQPCVKDVHIAGRRVVADGRHADGAAVLAHYRTALATISGGHATGR